MSDDYDEYRELGKYIRELSKDSEEPEDFVDELILDKTEELGLKEEIFDNIDLEDFVKYFVIDAKISSHMRKKRS